MYHALMVPLDGSEFGRHAIPWALAVAEPAGARVDLVHVLPPLYGMGVVDETLVTAEVRDAQRETAEQSLSDLAHRLHIGTGVSFSAAVDEGSIPDALVRHADENGVGLIVMTTHGRTGFARAVLGSVSDAVVRHGRRPVLLARPHRHPPEEREPAAVSEVLILLDGTAASEAIVDHAIELSRLTGAACTLLHVVVPELLPSGVATPPALADQRATVADERRYESYLASRAEQLRTADVPLTTAIVRHPDLAEGVLEYCASHPVSLIAMATRGRGGVERAVLGSVTDAVLRKTQLPILVVATRSDKGGKEVA
jgi:nucleotide-binding universal stress UspA family protein